MSGDGANAQATQALIGLNPHEDARAIVRLVQCQQCSYPLREPITLPCGNSLCRRCLPPTFKRDHITYPSDPRRSEGFVCPFRDCGLQHAVGDCSLDVLLNKMVEMVRSIVDKIRAQVPDMPLLLDEKLHWPSIVDSAIDVMPRSRVLHGGRIVATYVFADMGELDYYSEVAYAAASSSNADSVEALDVAVVHSVTEVIRGELECQVCYSIMLDPLTTSCGHTFCRNCVARVLDHSSLCPVCRRRLPIPPGVQAEPSNKRISMILAGLFPDQLASRMLARQQDEVVDEEARIPLFPCTLAYPHMPTFLHIFEPRYRLMIRRTLENGSRRFGILAYNALRRPQGTLGNVPFLQYGTMLNIQRVEMFPDGRSLIETTGLYRFRVLEHSMLDGYMVGRVQRIDDMSLAEEEHNEAQETAAAAESTLDPPPADNADPGAIDGQARFDRMPTQMLLQYALDFISSAQLNSAPWLHSQTLAAYGPPPTDPALFPYWFASVLPISEDEKYRLLPTTSVRERLKITARWIQRLEAATCNHDRALARTVLDSSSDDDDDSDDYEDEDDDGPDESPEVEAWPREGVDADETSVPSTHVMPPESSLMSTVMSSPPTLHATANIPSSASRPDLVEARNVSDAV